MNDVELMRFQAAVKKVMSGGTTLAQKLQLATGENEPSREQLKESDLELEDLPDPKGTKDYKTWLKMKFLHVAGKVMEACQKLEHQEP